MAYVSGELRMYILIRLRVGADRPNRNPDVFREPAHTSSSIEGISLYDLFPYCVPIVSGKYDKGLSVV